MSPRLLAALLGTLGGLVLCVAGVLAFVAGETVDWHDALGIVGYAATLAALCLIGYGIVASAPVWLRLIVSVAFPLLVASIWQVVDQTVVDEVGGWKGSATVHLAAGAIVLVTALVALRRSTHDGADSYAPTHR